MNIIGIILTVALGVLPSTPSRVEYTAAGGTQFTFTFKTFASSHVKVYKNTVLQSTGYSVTLNANQESSPGGTVTFTVAPVSGTVVRLERLLPITNDSAWTSFSSAAALGRDLDRAAMRDQQLRRDIDDVSTGVLTAGDASGALVSSSNSTTPRAERDRWADTVNVLDFVPANLHAGIAARTDTTDLLPYFNLAIGVIGTGGTVLVPKGSYHHTGLVTTASVHLKGLGWRATILVNDHATNPSITMNSQPGADYVVGGGSVEDLQITGAGTGAGFAYNTQTHALLRRVYISGTGGHGVQVGLTQHTYGLTIDGCVIQNVAGDGVYGKASYAKQVNAINILNGTEIAGSGGNGVNLWGLNINVKDSIIEGNQGYGLLLSEASELDLGSNVAHNVAVEGNYFEINKLGNIHVDVGMYPGSVAKQVRGLSIRDNYLNGAGANADAMNVVMTRVVGGAVTLDQAPYLTGLTFTGNTVEEDPVNTGTTARCDFGDAPGANSVIAPGEVHSLNKGDEANPSLLESLYLNVGLAHFDERPQRMVISGLYAKGAITYSDFTTGLSDPFTVVTTATRAYFPITLPQGSVFLDVKVRAETVHTNYSVEINVFERDPRTADGWTTFAAWTASGQSGAKLLEMPPIDSFTLTSSVRRLLKGREDLLLRITVTGANTGNTFRLGSPIIRYN